MKKNRLRVLLILLLGLQFIASCKKKTEYTVTFKIDKDTQIVKTLKCGDEIEVPELTEKEGYTFIGWNEEVPDIMPSKNLEFSAIYEANKYTVTYKIEGMDSVVERYEFGSKITPLENIEKEGYTFIGWDKELPELMPAAGIVVNAKFSKNSYTITFKAEGLEDIVVTYLYGDEVKIPSNPVKKEHIFLGWDKELPKTMPAENLEFVANFKVKTYKVTYKGIGINDIVQEYPAGETIQLPKNPYRNGFIFDGWLEEVPSIMPAKDLEFTAKFIQDRDYEGIIFIGHAGCYSGIMNTETAFINAGLKGYQAVECDLKQTKDGVFVLCHDDTFGGVTLASTNYNDLKDVTTTSTRGGIKYTSKICTLARYLEICKEYQMYPVIELKYSQGINNNDQSRMGALMAEIKKAGMLNQVIFLGSQYKCLEWVRNNGYNDIPCQYLVNSGDSEIVYNRCVEWKFDVSINIAGTNTKEWIDRYHSVGIKVSSYTFNQYQTAATLQKWIDMGVDYVTCDVLTEKDVLLPDYEAIGKLPKYTVRFYDYDGTLLKETIVKEGMSAGAPLNPSRIGYNFTGWDKEFNKVTSDLEVNAIYDLATYSITYNSNLNIIEEASWLTKQEFVNEFYQDWFNWLTSRVGKIPGLTKNGDTYTLVVGTSSNNTAVFSSYEDLMKLDVYVVERTIGTLVYKVVEGTNSADKIMVEDENYFLNTEPYRTKYKDLNRYFLSVMEKSYTSYSRNYAQSNGRVQIFFRFHQWQKGTNIPAFDELPKKYLVTIIEGVEVVLPQDHLTYTYEDSFTLSVASCSGYKFMGWYTSQNCKEDSLITEIAKGSYGDLILFAKWEKIE